MSLLLPPGWTPPIGYANGVVVPAGRIVFVAGQVGWDEQQRFHATMTSTLLCKTSEMRPGSCANAAYVDGQVLPFGPAALLERFAKGAKHRRERRHRPDHGYAPNPTSLLRPRRERPRGRRAAE